MARLHDKYKSEVVAKLMETYKYDSVMQVPALNKIVINVGVGDATSNSKLLDDAVRDLQIISGQKPVITKAKKSIASFKLREGMAIGCKVTLRGERMYEFFDKLVSITLPRVRVCEHRQNQQHAHYVEHQMCHGGTACLCVGGQ